MPECSDRYTANLRRGPLSPHRRSHSGLVEPERGTVGRKQQPEAFVFIHSWYECRTLLHLMSGASILFLLKHRHKQRAKEMTYFRFRETRGGRHTNGTTEGTKAKTSVRQGEGEKEVEQLPAPLALKI